jgi:hypothetical protein
VTDDEAAYKPGARIGWFNTAEAAGRLADRLTPTHPSSTFVITQTGPNGQWVLHAEERTKR